MIRKFVRHVLLLKKGGRYYFFSKFPSSENHIINCDRQEVIHRSITKNSLERYGEFANDLINGIFNNEDDEASEEGGGSRGENNHRYPHSINLKKINELIKAINNDEISLNTQLNNDYELFDLFKCIFEEKILRKIIENDEKRYYYIIFESVAVTSSNNFMLNLRTEDNERKILYINIDVNNRNKVKRNKNYDVIIIAKARDFKKVERQGDYRVFDDYRIDVPNNRILFRVRIKKQNSIQIIYKKLEQYFKG